MRRPYEVSLWGWGCPLGLRLWGWGLPMGLGMPDGAGVTYKGGPVGVGPVGWGHPMELGKPYRGWSYGDALWGWDDLWGAPMGLG